jgi:uncharacterized protein with beta-barrel porin domain
MGASGLAAGSGGIQSATPAGSSGAVSVNLTSSGIISTAGDFARGISVSTGYGRYIISALYHRPITPSSTGGAINVTSSGKISTVGIRADGINALSLVGTPSIMDAGKISITTSGNVLAAGRDADAIHTETFGSDSAIRIAAGTVTGGSGAGVGVHLTGGGNNTLTNFGTITTSSGLAGTAVLGDAIPCCTAAVFVSKTFDVVTPTVIGNNTVSNAGVIIGNVDLGPGTNAFNNQTGGTFNAGATVKLGTGNTLSNSGDLSPGGRGVIQTTALTGNLVQTNSGRITVDVDTAAGRADRINASGTAQLAGQVVVNPTNVLTPLSTTAITILHADGGVTNNGLSLASSNLFGSAVVTPELEFPDPNDLVFQTAVDFAPPGLNRNQMAIGQNINAIQAAGSSASFLPVAQALMTLPDVQSLGQAYDQLSPETYADNEIAQYFAGLHFANSLMSCSVPDGRYAFISEGQCVWARIGGRFLNVNPTGQDLGFSETAFQLAGGAQLALQPDWFAGFALGYDRGDQSTSGSLTTSHGDRLHAGAVIKYNPGPLLLSAAVYGGYGWYDTSRQMNFDNFGALAQSNSTISHVGGQLRASYLLDQGSWYVKPLIDLNLTHIALDSFSEHGAGGANLIVSGTNNTLFSGSPEVEIGAQMEMQDGNLLRPFA